MSEIEFYVDVETGEAQLARRHTYTVDAGIIELDDMVVTSDHPPTVLLGAFYDAFKAGREAYYRSLESVGIDVVVPPELDRTMKVVVQTHKYN